MSPRLLCSHKINLGELRKCCLNGTYREHKNWWKWQWHYWMSPPCQALCRVFYIHYLIFLQPCIIENFQTYKSRIIQWTPVCSLPIFNSWPVLFHLCPYLFPLRAMFWNQFQTNTVSSVRFQYALYRVHFSLSHFCPCSLRVEETWLFAL